MARIALCQSECCSDVQVNLERSVAQIERAAAEGAQIVCLQEVFHLRYPCQTEDHDRFSLAEEFPGPTTSRLSRVARELQIVLIVPFFERRAAGIYHNSATVIDADGAFVGLYRKMHIPDDPLYYEKFYFTPGDNGFQSFATRYGSVGVCICWDQWFPEAARLTALAGAEYLFFPTAIGWIPGEKDSVGAAQHDAWRTMLRSHAIANGVYVGAPNRVGPEGEIEFWGQSLLVDPYGVVLAEGCANAAEIVTAECDPASIETARTHWPFFRDRRIDAFADLQLRWGGKDGGSHRFA